MNEWPRQPGNPVITMGPPLARAMLPSGPMRSSVRWVLGASALAVVLGGLVVGVPCPARAQAPPPIGAAPMGDLMPAYASLRAIALMTDTGQALLWDDGRAEYVVLKVGEERGGWKLVAVEKTQAIVVQGAGLREELKLVAAPTEIVAAAPAKGKKRTTAFVVESDPRAIAPGAAALPLTPALPPEPGGFMAAVQGQVPAPEPRLETRNVKRAEFDREIGNFDRLLDQVTVAPAAGGGVILQRMKSPFLTKLGLKEGDVVRTVAGEQVSTVEAAARVYAQLRSARTFMVELDRAGSRIVIRCDLG